LRALPWGYAQVVAAAANLFCAGTNLMTSITSGAFVPVGLIPTVASASVLAYEDQKKSWNRPFLGNSMTMRNIIDDKISQQQKLDGLWNGD
jgi:hypothetical protein